VSRIRGQYITNTVIKVNPSIWPIPNEEHKQSFEPQLAEALLSLPPSFSVNVDPEDLL
jgi:hypothetical protein